MKVISLICRRLGTSGTANRRDDLVGAQAVSWLHGAVAPFLSSAGQLTITCSGGEACSRPVSARNRWPSRVASYTLTNPATGGGSRNSSRGAEGSTESAPSLRLTV